MKHLILSLSIVSILSCNNPIKNDNTLVYDEVIDSNSLSNHSDTINSTENHKNNEHIELYGYWVGDFEMNEKDEEKKWGKAIAKDEGLSWYRNNKINISINKLENGKAYGHSVVAGNHRPFEGTYTIENNLYKFDVNEPGDDKYDGKFKFEILQGDSLLTGTWSAYKNIDIKEREYELKKRTFKYDPNQQLTKARRYANWDKELKTEYLTEDDEGSFMDFQLEFESATEEIYNFNASNRKLSKADVENLKRGDLFIIRNTIYARHGYSFKNRPLRIFFDAQPWYIPVHNDIKKDLTDVEKENIKLLMKYEKNAKTYYDYFGRG